MVEIFNDAINSLRARQLNIAAEETTKLRDSLVSQGLLHSYTYSEYPKDPTLEEGVTLGRWGSRSEWSWEIDELGLSSYTRNVFVRSGITLIAQLEYLHERQLLSEVRNVGKKRIEEITMRLQTYRRTHPLPPLQR